MIDRPPDAPVNMQPIQPGFHLEVLSADEIAQIQSAALHVLEQVGVQFPSQRALRVFAGHGALVDEDSQVVRLLADLFLHASRPYQGTQHVCRAPQQAEPVLQSTGT